MAKNIKTIPTSEYDEVVRVIQEYYCNGCHKGNTSLLAKAFHKDATMYGFTMTGELLGGPISNLYDFINQHGDAPNIKTRIDIIGITLTTAVVKVDMERDAAEQNYTDFHTMMKFDGEWKIIAKVFHTYES
ncbi:unnamed protein product [Clonostachys rosea f. rosea IK726]|uniref:Uncharacterized protein n=1 Tax=Clonostachys rosea f. rosea IK726 TaxID=1349383 RepID=A0ACA9U1C6_BIOOC|nr:unnamed protein product [Clonostachys rosea f. rosea IK726]